MKEIVKLEGLFLCSGIGRFDLASFSQRNDDGDRSPVAYWFFNKWG